MSTCNHEQQKSSVCEHIPDGAQTTPPPNNQQPPATHHQPPLYGDKSSSMSSGPMDLFFYFVYQINSDVEQDTLSNSLSG